MSNEQPAKVHGQQVDPGMHWAMVRVHVYDQYNVKSTVATILATNTRGEGYGSRQEYWHGHDGAATAMSNATKLQFEHLGAFEWDEFEAEWGSEEERHSASLVAAVAPDYASASTGPSPLFEGTHDDGNTLMRSVIEFDGNDDVVSAFWAYKPLFSAPTYLIEQSTNTLLDKSSSPSWPAGWVSVEQD